MEGFTAKLVALIWKLEFSKGMQRPLGHVMYSTWCTCFFCSSCSSHVLRFFAECLQYSHEFICILPYLLLFEDVFMKDVTLEGAYVPEAYTSYERSEVRKVFKAFDEDGSGSLDTEEIEQVMCSFGITPFKSTVEALPEVYSTFPQGLQKLLHFTNCTGIVVVCGRRNKFQVQIQQKVKNKLISRTWFRNLQLLWWTKTPRGS